MKKIILILLIVASNSCFAALPNPEVKQSLPTNHRQFCTSFKQAAISHCTSRHLPLSFCQDLRRINTFMLMAFGSLKRVCTYQKETSPQSCIDAWNCYLDGGKDSQGRLCSSTGKSCVS